MNVLCECRVCECTVLITDVPGDQPAIRLFCPLCFTDCGHWNEMTPREAQPGEPAEYSVPFQLSKAELR